MRQYTTLLLIMFLSTAHLSIHAQSELIGYPRSPQIDLSELNENIAHYNIYMIDVIKKKIKVSSESPFVNLTLGDQVFEMNMYKGNLTTSFEAADKPLLLGGSMRNGGIVSMTINNDFIFGFIKQGKSKLYIEPLRHFIKTADKDLFVVYDVAHVIENGNHVCGSDQVAEKTTTPEHIHGPYKVTTACKIIDMAIANTFDMIAAHGGSSINVMTYNLAILNDVQTNYRSEFDSNLEFDVVAHFVPTSMANNPLSPNTTSSQALTILNAFTNWAGGGGNSGGASGGFNVDYHQAHVWTDKNIADGSNFDVVGLAWTPGWHSLLEDFSDDGVRVVAMVSHEMGHNFNCLHDSSNANIMYPSVLLTDVWNTTAKNAVNVRIANQTYLLDCSTIGPPVANFFQSALATCINSSVTYEDQSQYGATRNWEFNMGSPTTSTVEKQDVSYSSLGLFHSKITSTNGSGSDDHENYVDVQNVPGSPCTPSGSGGNGGITFVRLSNVFNYTGNSGVYEDFSCSEVATVTSSTTYTFSVGITNVTRLRYFVDYNGDGDFTDAGESSPQYTLSVNNATYGIPFTSASNPMTAKMLRMRIIVSTGTIASTGCTIPSTGQVEDYSLYFAVTQVLGCTDPLASNYDPSATVDDGSCMFGSITWYRDFDNDTYGDPNVSQNSSSQPPGYILDNTDCDDTDGDINPGVAEICDGIDNNCNMQIDEGVQDIFYRDLDNDSYGDPSMSMLSCTQPSGYVSNNLDCDDNDGLEFPGQFWYKDIDGDQYGDGTTVIQCLRPTNYYVTAELINVDGDCNDNNPNMNPGEMEVCDGIDNDCDMMTDEGVLINFYRDLDDDNFGDPNVFIMTCSAPTGYVSNNTDCDDNDSDEFPGQTWHKDIDGDQYGDGTSIVQCNRPTDYYTSSELINVMTDCDDGNNLIYPGATEYCDGDDNDCDMTIDEGCIDPLCDDQFLTINMITQSVYRAEIGIISDAMVTSTDDVTFIAGDHIELEPDFEVQLGGLFEAIIAPCTNTFDSPEGPDDFRTINESENPMDRLSEELENVFNDDEEIIVTILNKEGQTIDNVKTNLRLNFLSQRMESLEKGIYLFKIFSDTNEYIKRVVLY